MGEVGQQGRELGRVVEPEVLADAPHAPVDRVRGRAHDVGQRLGIGEPGEEPGDQEVDLLVAEPEPGQAGRQGFLISGSWGGGGNSPL